MKSKIYLIIISIFVLIILLKGYLFNLKYVADDYTKEYYVFIQSLKSKSDTKVSYNVKLVDNQDKFILNILDSSYDNVKTNLTKYSDYKYGDVIRIKGKISIPQKLNNPGEFDYKLYLYSNNICGLINTYDEPIKIQYRLTFLERVNSKIYEFKKYIQNIIQNSMNETNANIAVSMIYGDTTDLDENIKEDFETIGVSHLMSVSGTHITSFMVIINTLLRVKRKQTRTRDERNKENNKRKTCLVIKGIIQISCILVYMVFTGLSVSVMRAGMTLIISIICNMLSVKKGRYLSWSISLAIILLISPYSICGIGMQLSFFASLGIIVFWKDISKMFCKTTYNIQNKILKKISEYILENIAITVAVQLMIIPIQIQTFNMLSFPIITPNLILGFISMPIRVMGTFGIMISFIPKLSSKTFLVTEVFVKLLVKSTKLLKKFSLEINIVSMPLMFFVLYYLFVGILAVYFKLKKIKNKTYSAKIDLNKLIKFVKKIGIILLVITVVFTAWLNIYQVYFSKYVYFFNVEQGDMSYVKYGKSGAIVDMGSMRNNLAFNIISNYFKANNITGVDVVIISHMHSDHMNGLEEFLKEFSVGQVIYAKPKNISSPYTEFLNLLDKYNVTGKEVRGDNEINIGKIKIKILLPTSEYINSEDEENANSLVCKITLNKKSLLYMGDGSAQTEQKLLKQNNNINDIYILKVGHHGSKTSTSNIFIQKIKPQNAVISALEKYYGHPHENTLNTLKENNVWIYLTEKQGAIKFSLR